MSEIHISNYWTNYVREKMDMVTVDVLDIAQAFNERNSRYVFLAWPLVKFYHLLNYFSSPVQRGALANLHSLVYKKELKMRNLLTLKKLCMKSIMENFNVEPSPLNISCSDISDAMLRKCLIQNFPIFWFILEVHVKFLSSYKNSWFVYYIISIISFTLQVCFSIPNQISASALREEFLQFLTGQEYFHELRWNIAHLGILLVNSNTTCLDVRRLFETDRIDADVEQRVSLI